MSAEAIDDTGLPSSTDQEQQDSIMQDDHDHAEPGQGEANAQSDQIEHSTDQKALLEGTRQGLLDTDMTGSTGRVGSTSEENTLSISNDQENLPGESTGVGASKLPEALEHTNETKPSQPDVSATENRNAVTEKASHVTNTIPHTIPDPAEQSTGHETTGSTSIAEVITSKIQSRPASRATSVMAHNNGDSSTTGAPTRVYLKEQVNDYLLEGMRWLALTRPDNGLLALGNYLCSADSWRNRSGNDHRIAADFHRYWLQFQTWKGKEGQDKTETDFIATL
ncbi:protein of unknown function [Taphrina deformans PYCC 5710]|uniref:Uncharacterized protein n=1 Tax=Taphrina deformans (strain PYCC 5710 / ATCC 11124 / CBS 356.35 / IMI 108563 / JCM 9778 / NBRC 8474) TaxID=1097556 RepID=R4X8K5_TAPDE|nr:protein of unknown function [Taphrina deformans PYCC 5710]|eukprot:CCG81680.1 protein of unknown function [Taphrina deformans PYCC 5710]